jgi:hypothetical protein
MIEVSDNDAATTLYDHVGGPSGLRPFNSRVGMQATYPSWHWGLTTTNPKDQVSLLQTFAYPNNTLSNKRRHHGLFLMRHVVSWQRWGVTAGVTTARRVAIKNGWLPLSEGWVVNSLGKVSGDGRNYVIAVLTRHGPSESYSIDTIQHLSAGVFRVLGY